MSWGTENTTEHYCSVHIVSVAMISTLHLRGETKQQFMSNSCHQFKGNLHLYCPRLLKEGIYIFQVQLKQMFTAAL